MGLILTVVRVFLFNSLFPLLGLNPKDPRSLIIVPAGFLLWTLVGLVAGYLFVPGSPADVVYGLGADILMTARISPILYVVVGLILASTYVTLYLWLYPRLPAWLQTERRPLTWKDLRFPALLALISVVLGIIIIT